MSDKGCLKCGSKEAGQKEIAMTGTGLSKIFDIQHNTFIVIFCKNGATPNYIIRISRTSNILDLFFGG